MNGRNPPPVSPEKKTSGLAIWSLVLSILGFTCISIFGSIPGVICGHLALSRIKRSPGTLEGKGLAIGGLVTGYVGIATAIFIIPLMLAIAIPNFVRARHIAMQNGCINNLRQIEGAKQTWALENKAKPTDTPTEAQLAPYLPGHMLPKCLAGGTYQINDLSHEATCSVPGHQLSPP